MSLVTRQGKGSRLTIEEMDNNFLYLQELAQNGLTNSYITGVQGPQGVTGPQGLQGLQGIAGPQGLQGATGPQGPQGVTGPQGLQGNQGNVGPVGPAGLTWAGIWIATQSYQQNYAVGYASASWWCISSVTGSISNISPDLDNTHWSLLAAQGSPGPQGPQGVQGIAGPQGLQGITGPQGPQGVTGPQGLQGVQGIAGPQGLQGATGPQGATATINIEVISTSVIATASVIVYDYNLNNMWYHATASNNYTANFINLPTTNNRVLTASILINQGLNAYIPNIVQINGVTQSIKWAAGTQSGTTNSLDLISFSFIRINNSWINVIGQIAPFY